MTAPLSERMLPTPEAATFLGLGKSTLDKLRLEGGGPPFIKFGRRVVYSVPDLRDWAAKHRRSSTSEQPDPKNA